MKKKGYLLIAGSFNFFVAMIHVVAIFVGAPAYYFLDAPQLAVYSEQGSMYPVWLTLFVTSLFLIAGLYTLCAVGTKIKLPLQAFMLKLFAVIYTLRGVAVFWFIYQEFKAPTEAALKEIAFSSCALMIGIFYWMSLLKKRSGKSFSS